MQSKHRCSAQAAALKGGSAGTAWGFVANRVYMAMVQEAFKNTTLAEILSEENPCPTLREHDLELGDGATRRRRAE